jgi:hypothetical protein
VAAEADALAREHEQMAKAIQRNLAENEKELMRANEAEREALERRGLERRLEMNRRYLQDQLKDFQEAQAKMIQQTQLDVTAGTGVPLPAGQYRALQGQGAQQAGEVQTKDQAVLSAIKELLNMLRGSGGGQG